MGSPTVIKNQVKRLASVYRELQISENTDEAREQTAERTRIYFMVLDEFNDQDIVAGVDLVFRGKLPDHRQAFAPTPPQLATACRMVRNARLESEHRGRLRLPAPEVERSPPEVRARIVAELAEKIRSRA